MIYHAGAGAAVDARGGSDGRTTALLAAVQRGHPEAARALVVAGASPALANEQGEDAFELAVEGDHGDVLRSLLTNGMNHIDHVDHVDSHLTIRNRTLLAHAALFGKPRALHVLLQAGAEVDRQTVGKFCPPQSAVACNVCMPATIRRCLSFVGPF